MKYIAIVYDWKINKYRVCCSDDFKEIKDKIEIYSNENCFIEIKIRKGNNEICIYRKDPKFY